MTDCAGFKDFMLTVQKSFTNGSSSYSIDPGQNSCRHLHINGTDDSKSHVRVSLRFEKKNKQEIGVKISNLISSKDPIANLSESRFHGLDVRQDM